jgi:hypothetical protein
VDAVLGPNRDACDERREGQHQSSDHDELCVLYEFAVLVVDD